jgi:UDP-glucose 6-dehydrogenase
VIRVGDNLGKILKIHKLIINKHTVPVSTMDKISEAIAKKTKLANIIAE